MSVLEKREGIVLLQSVEVRTDVAESIRRDRDKTQAQLDRLEYRYEEAADKRDLALRELREWIEGQYADALPTPETEGGSDD